MRMKVLIVIPHYYNAGSGGYGATDPDGQSDRLSALRTCILSLHQHLGNRQSIIPHVGKPPAEANRLLSHQLDIRVCVTGTSHLLDQLALSSDLYQQQVIDLDNPLALGYACHTLLREEWGRYDWYCYLEDDIIIADPLFFEKLALFQYAAGSDYCLLQPNRYELERTTGWKNYIDGDLWESNLMEQVAGFRPQQAAVQIEIPFGFTHYSMHLAGNPHAGCFFLTAAQFGMMLAQPWFGCYSEAFCGPMESAASLGIMSLFHVYKPAREHAAFLEVRHAHQRYVSAQ